MPSSDLLTNGVFGGPDDGGEQPGFLFGLLARGDVPDDAGEDALAAHRISLTPSSIGKVVPSLRRAVTSRPPTPMILAFPVSQ